MSACEETSWNSHFRCYVGYIKLQDMHCISYIRF